MEEAPLLIMEEAPDITDEAPLLAPAVKHGQNQLEMDQL